MIDVFSSVVVFKLCCCVCTEIFLACICESKVCAHADIYIYAVCMTAWILMHADSCSVDSVVSKYHKTFMKEDFDLESSVQIYCKVDHIGIC